MKTVKLSKSWLIKNIYKCGQIIRSSKLYGPDTEKIYLKNFPYLHQDNTWFNSFPEELLIDVLERLQADALYLLEGQLYD